MQDSGGFYSLTLSVLVVVVIAVIIWGRWKEKARIAAMTPEERAVFEAEQEHQRRVKEVAGALAGAQRQFDSGVKIAEHSLQHAYNMGTNQLAKYSGQAGWVKLHENRIETSSGSAAFENGPVIATVDATGGIYESRRSTVTRVVTGGLVFGPPGAVVGAIAKKRSQHDSRELYLLVESSRWGALIKCKPDDGPRVRELAMKINAASRNADSIKAAREHAIAQATSSLESARLNTAALDEAGRVLAAAEADTARVDQARAALAARRAAENQPQQEADCNTTD
ncbi:MAG: hypothetical protein RBS78_00485 [Coriobacteriia bacterium]|jgi:hypothetical protein|nr:hypothetical protein [Coriobacteriia bacterium]